MKNGFITLLIEALPMIGFAFLPLILVLLQGIFSDAFGSLEELVSKQDLLGNINWKAAH